MPLKTLAATTMSFGLAIAGLADVNVVVTDGNGRFAEGRLDGFLVQKDGKTLCATPYAIGKYISCRGSIAVGGRVWTAPDRPVWAETSGVLGAMVVLDDEGAVVCESPMVEVNFRNPANIITCNRG